MPSRLMVLKPGSANVTEYVPGGSATIRYWPVPSVVTTRTFSVSAGLVASTVTPGSTAADTSRTTPAIVACARAAAGTVRTAPQRTMVRATTRILGPLPQRNGFAVRIDERAMVGHRGGSVNPGIPGAGGEKSLDRLAGP